MDFELLDKYASPRTYRIYDWQDNYLLLRGEGGMFVGNDIDLIFLGVKYIELPIELRGVEISKPRNEEAISFEQKYAPDQFTDFGERTYLIESEGKKFYVIASKMWIHLNINHITESSLPYLLNDDVEKRELYLSDNVEARYKIK